MRGSPKKRLPTICRSLRADLITLLHGTSIGIRQRLMEADQILTVALHVPGRAKAPRP
jgi:hypothetical protein